MEIKVHEAVAYTRGGFRSLTKFHNADWDVRVTCVTADGFLKVTVRKVRHSDFSDLPVYSMYVYSVYVYCYLYKTIPFPSMRQEPLPLTLHKKKAVKSDETFSETETEVMVG